MPSPGRPLLARERVRFVGEPVALVVAETWARRAMRPNASSRRLRAAAGGRRHRRGARRGRAGAIWDGAADNIAFFWERGDEAKVENALQHAAHVVG